MLFASTKEGFMVPRRESGRAVCSNDFTSQEVAVLTYIPRLQSGRATPPFSSTYSRHSKWHRLTCSSGEICYQTETRSKGLVLFVLGGGQDKRGYIFLSPSSSFQGVRVTKAQGNPHQYCAFSRRSVSISNRNGYVHDRSSGQLSFSHKKNHQS